ncbi:hypothetical protein HDU82_006215, partial [Entophlyctis luteolus]
MEEKIVDVEAAAVSRSKRNKIIIGGSVLAVVVVAAALIGYFVSKNNSSSTAASNAGNSTSIANSSGKGSTTGTTASPTAAATVVPGTFRLIGYFGADAMANGVDLEQGVLTPTSDSSYYQKDLKYYCDTGYFNTINIAFLNLWGGGSGHFQITLGGFSTANYVTDGTYVYNGDGKESNSASVVTSYQNIGMDITHCQSKGIKVLMSLGGDKVSDYSFSTGDGKLYANLWYNMFLEGSSSVRPFGAGVVLDGIELDVEKNLAYPGTQPWNQEMIDLITTLRSLSPQTTLAIVPQCYLSDANYPGKDANVGDVIPAVADKLDYLIVQYYNNPVCSYPVNFNFEDWTKVFSGKIVVGLAGDWTSAISGGFLEPGPLQAVFDQVKTSSQFLGFSVYDVSSSTAPALEHTIANYGSTLPTTHYSQTLRNVLDGTTVGSGYPSQASLGVQTGSSAFTSRCGATWAHANATCGAVCISDSSTTPPAPPTAAASGLLLLSSLVSAHCDRNYEAATAASSAPSITLTTPAMEICLHSASSAVLDSDLLYPPFSSPQNTARADSNPLPVDLSFSESDMSRASSDLDEDDSDDEQVIDLIRANSTLDSPDDVAQEEADLMLTDAKIPDEPEISDPVETAAAEAYDSDCDSDSSHSSDSSSASSCDGSNGGSAASIKSRSSSASRHSSFHNFSEDDEDYFHTNKRPTRPKYSAAKAQRKRLKTLHDFSSPSHAFLPSVPKACANVPVKKLKIVFAPKHGPYPSDSARQYSTSSSAPPAFGDLVETDACASPATFEHSDFDPVKNLAENGTPKPLALFSPLKAPARGSGPNMRGGSIAQRGRGGSGRGRGAKRGRKPGTMVVIGPDGVPQVCFTWRFFGLTLECFAQNIPRRPGRPKKYPPQPPAIPLEHSLDAPLDTQSQHQNSLNDLGFDSHPLNHSSSALAPSVPALELQNLLFPLSHSIGAPHFAQPHAPESLQTFLSNSKAPDSYELPASVPRGVGRPSKRGGWIGGRGRRGGGQLTKARLTAVSPPSMPMHPPDVAAAADVGRPLQVSAISDPSWKTATSRMTRRESAGSLGAIDLASGVNDLAMKSPDPDVDGNENAMSPNPSTKPSHNIVAPPSKPSKASAILNNTYSKIHVWESHIDGVVVMRRVADGWFNATHLLKLAGFCDKSQRTRMLERMAAAHGNGGAGLEKVQGGFGRYQGTWIPAESAMALAEEYGITEKLKPLFNQPCNLDIDSAPGNGGEEPNPG